MHLCEQVPGPGYAGALEAGRDPALADRFHFWRGASGSRYACTKFRPDAAPSYVNSVAIWVRWAGGTPFVVDVRPGDDVEGIGPPADEIHLHLVRNGASAVDAALADLRVLVTKPHNDSVYRDAA